MPVFTNISEVLTFIGSDARFMPVALPYGFNHWSEGARQLREDNPEFFKDDRQFDAATQAVGVLAVPDKVGAEAMRGWMAIFPNSRYVVSDWTKRLHKPSTVVQAGLLGIAVRKALVELTKVAK